MTTKNLNVYVNLATIKSALKRTNSDEDSLLLMLAQRASRLIDNYCDRNFYNAIASKTFRSRLGYVRLFLPDLLSITSITIDDVTLNSADYELEPLSENPKTRLRLLNSTFASRELVAITGKWGYDEILEAVTDSVQDASGINASVTTLTPATIANYSVGDMLLCESEQIYVSALKASSVTIARAQNGTTGASHAKDKTIYFLRAPDPIQQACLMQIIRYYRGRDAAYSGNVGGEASMSFKEPALEIRVLLNPYKRYSFGD